MDICPNCGYFEINISCKIEYKNGLQCYTICLSDCAVEALDSVMLKEVIKLKTEQARTEFEEKLGLNDGTHDLSRELEKK